MKLAFFGSGQFGVPTLKKLYDEYAIDFVVTNPAKPAKRGKSLINTPIFDCATELGITRIYTPEKLDPSFVEHLKKIDYGIVVSYGKLLSESLLKAVKVKFLNLHPSSLPLFRGAAPIERTIESGYKEIDVCILEMVKKLDAGKILAKQRYNILPDENSIDLHIKLADIGSELMLNTLKLGNTINEEQDDTKATYAHKISKEELQLHSEEKNDTALIFNKIRAFASYGYCFLFYQGKRFKIISAKVVSSRITPIDIECTDGFISPTVIRPEGKGNLIISDYQF